MTLLNALLGIFLIGINFFRRTQNTPFIPDVHPVTRERLYEMCEGDTTKAHFLVSKITTSNPQLAWMEAIESLR